MKQGGGLLFNKRAKEELTIFAVKEDAGLAMEALQGLVYDGAGDFSAAIPGQDSRSLCLVTPDHLKTTTLGNIEKQYKEGISSLFGKFPELRQQHEGKNTKFEMLAEDDNNGQKVVIKLLAVDEEENKGVFGFLWN